MSNNELIIKAVQLARSGRDLVAHDALHASHPTVAHEDIAQAVRVGRILNQELWSLADAWHDKQITDAAFKSRVQQLCPQLDPTAIDQLFGQATDDAQ